MVPWLVRFSQYANMTSGLEALYPGFQLTKDGVGLVTGWIATEGWLPNDDVTTGWTLQSAAVSTSWTDQYTQPTTGWTLL